MFNQYNLRAVTSRQEVVYVTNNIVHTLMSYYKRMQNTSWEMLCYIIIIDTTAAKEKILLIKYKEILIIITEKSRMGESLQSLLL